MTDDVRIAELTAMARRVWPGEGEATRVTSDENMAHVWAERTKTAILICHPRALDALEAALQELLQKPSQSIASALDEERRRIGGEIANCVEHLKSFDRCGLDWLENLADRLQQGEP
jgi:hypothetical protein